MDPTLLRELNECAEIASQEIDRIANDPDSVQELKKRLTQINYSTICYSDMLSSSQATVAQRYKGARYKG